MKNAPLSPDRAKIELNRCLDDGLVIYSRHFKDELAKVGTGGWKYRIEGWTADKEDVALVFTFKLEQKAVFITVFKRTHG